MNLMCGPKAYNSEENGRGNSSDDIFGSWEAEECAITDLTSPKPEIPSLAAGEFTTSVICTTVLQTQNQTLATPGKY